MAEPAQDWVWASELPDVLASKDVLCVLREIMHDDTPVSRSASLPFFPFDVLKVVAGYLDYGYRVHPLSTLPSLLYHPQHPAKLVKHQCAAGTMSLSLLYLHLWHEGHATYVRGFYTLFQARHTPKGIHHELRWSEYSIAVDASEEDKHVLGHTDDVTGVLVDWFVTELAKNPIHYLGSADALLLQSTLETRKGIILSRIDPRMRLIQPDQTCLIKIHVDHGLERPILDVFRAGVSKPLYTVPKQDKKHEDLATYQARVDALNLPSLCDLVPPRSTIDVSWLLMGWIVNGMRTGHMTRAMQVSQSQPAASDTEGYCSE
jgi:hypothetical protein